MIKAKDMLELGIADKMFPNGEFYDMSFDLLVDLIDGKVKIDRKPADWSKLNDLYTAPRRSSTETYTERPSPRIRRSNSSRAPRTGT